MNKNSVFNFFNGIGLSTVLRNRKKNKLTVLSLHRVSPEDDFFWNPMKPATFEYLLKYLKKHYNVVLLNDIPDIIKKKGSTKPFVILSFDDGYYDFYEYALPLLNKYKLPSNHNIVNECAQNNTILWTQRLNFIFDHCRKNNIPLAFEGNDKKFSPGDFGNNRMSFYLAVYKWMLTLPKEQRISLLSEKERSLSVTATVKMMNWQQVAECAANGVEIGSHTYSHDVISTITDEAVLHKEIVQSTMELQQKINKKINILALPNGEGHPNLVNPVLEAAIEYVLYVGDKLNDFTQLHEPVRSVYRINLVEESLPAMILRTEMFHSKMKKYV